MLEFSQSVEFTMVTRSRNGELDDLELYYFGVYYLYVKSGDWGLYPLCRFDGGVVAIVTQVHKTTCYSVP